MANSEYQALKSALLWHIDAGADIALSDTPVSKLGLLEAKLPIPEESVKSLDPLPFQAPPAAPAAPTLLGASEARGEAARLAQAAQTLDDLRAAIAAFDGIGLKGTATNLVFSDGNPSAPIMLIGEAPGTDEDREGKPFAGPNGVLLDAILKTAGLSRTESDPSRSLYISNILNWRPPGNRSPTPAEIEVSLPFIERHVQLIAPKLLILAGGIAAKALLGDEGSISKLRGRWLTYLPKTPELQNGATSILVLATYHPTYLIQNPAQKRAVWADMLMLLEKRQEFDLIS